LIKDFAQKKGGHQGKKIVRLNTPKQKRPQRVFGGFCPDIRRERYVKKPPSPERKLAKILQKERRTTNSRIKKGRKSKTRDITAGRRGKSGFFGTGKNEKRNGTRG